MKVTGFSIIKNAVTYDYPIVEAIRSILPICDEFVIAVGRSDDDTLDLIQKIDPQKIRIIETVWDEKLREGGRVLAAETDKAFAEISKDSDWAFYIQGDEVVHEKYLKTIRASMLKYQNTPNVDGLLFKYLHFYGSYNYVGVSSNWYENEIRVVKNDRSIYSYRDAQGFRKGENEKLRVVPIDAFVYHYGWVKAPEAMQRKHKNFHKYWHDDEWIKNNIAPDDRFNFREHAKELTSFSGTHPEVMLPRIERENYSFDFDVSKSRRSGKDRFKAFLKKIGIDTSYKNYKVVKPMDGGR